MAASSRSWPRPVSIMQPWHWISSKRGGGRRRCAGTWSADTPGRTLGPNCGANTVTQSARKLPRFWLRLTAIALLVWWAGLVVDQQALVSVLTAQEEKNPTLGAALEDVPPSTAAADSAGGRGKAAAKHR